MAEPLGVGLQRDLATFTATYASHLTDGISLKVVSATAFLVFGCLAPAVAFGALCEKVTHGAMGTVEMVLGTALSVRARLLSTPPLSAASATSCLRKKIQSLDVDVGFVAPCCCYSCCCSRY